MAFSEKLRRFNELPHYYQCLGKACLAAGILDEFYASVDAGFDYGQALASLQHPLQQQLEATSVEAWLEHFGVPSEFEVADIEYEAENR